MEYLKAPFPWFGGKSRAAKLVWRVLGDVDNYVEPFAGSLAVLLGRTTKPKTETVNDIDMYIVNFWRAVQHAPDEVAHYANNLVNEADLTARHIWLVNTGKERILRIQGDPDYYDAKVAGWWVWGISCWIGSGFCSGKGSWTADESGRIVKRTKTINNGISKQLVHLGNPGKGVNRQVVHLGNPGQGVNRQIVNLKNPGEGIHRTSLTDHNSLGVRTGEDALIEYMNKLAERIRYVRVCCGDWSRVVTPGALAYGKTVGIFLDPPYDVDERERVYNTDEDYGNVSEKVRQWCIENAHNPRYRIVLSGYDGEHEMPSDWRVVEWKANRAYGSSKNINSRNNANRFRERLWLSPNCLPLDDENDLFSAIS